VGTIEQESELAAQLKRLSSELDARAARHRLVLPYSQRTKDGQAIPPAVIQAKLTRAYNHLMAMSGMPWGKLVINSKLDRLEVTGIDTGDEKVDEMVWREVWQSNAMDLESRLGMRSALRDGRAHALVWPDKNGQPEVTLDDVTQMIVEFPEGRRRRPTAAMRRWCDDDGLDHATLYRPDGIYKFRKKREGDAAMVKGSDWIRREVTGEPWPLPNPFNVVPVAELAVNRDLAPGRFTWARGEYEDEIGLMDRINLLTFLGLVVALWMGFPLRGVIGERIAWRMLEDDEGNPLLDASGAQKQVADPPFDAYADSMFQLENPDATLAEYKAADRGNLSIYDELAQLAAATSTPRHYFPVAGAISNISAETILAFEGAMHATVKGSHKPSLGEGFETILRLGGLMLPTPLVVPEYAELQWADHESRSLSERADAFVKLAGGDSGLPWIAAAELTLNLSQEQLRRYAAEHAESTAMAQLIDLAQQPPAKPVLPVAA
jgi:hypothetical protein